MIAKRNMYCSTPELIENYQKALDSPEPWVCHHRRETHNEKGELLKCFLSSKELKEKGMYFDLPPSELIYMSKKDHTALHLKDKRVYFKLFVRDTKRKLASKAFCKGEYRTVFNRMPVETFEETVERLKGTLENVKSKEDFRNMDLFYYERQILGILYDFREIERCKLKELKELKTAVERARLIGDLDSQFLLKSENPSTKGLAICTYTGKSKNILQNVQLIEEV